MISLVDYVPWASCLTFLYLRFSFVKSGKKFHRFVMRHERGYKYSTSGRVISLKCVFNGKTWDIVRGCLVTST